MLQKWKRRGNLLEYNKRFWSIKQKLTNKQAQKQNQEKQNLRKKETSKTKTHI